MFKPLKVPLSQVETFAKLEYYTSLKPTLVQRTFFGSTVYHYKDGTRILLYNNIQCNIWDPETERWGYTSREMAQKFATILNRTQI